MKKNIRKLSESFLHAFRGLRLCIHDERNFRVPSAVRSCLRRAA